MTRRQAVPTEKTPVTWILVADGRQAQVYVRRRVEKRVPMAGSGKHRHYAESCEHALEPVTGMGMKAESPDQYEVGRNATGMVFQSSGGARHMSEPRMDVHEEIKVHFAGAIAGQLNDAKARKAFDRLVLVATPKMLGGIKKQLNEDVRESVVAELPKELTHCDGEALLEHLQPVFQPSA